MKRRFTVRRQDEQQIISLSGTQRLPPNTNIFRSNFGPTRPMCSLAYTGCGKVLSSLLSTRQLQAISRTEFHIFRQCPQHGYISEPFYRPSSSSIPADCSLPRRRPVSGCTRRCGGASSHLCIFSFQNSGSPGLTGHGENNARPKLARGPASTLCFALLRRPCAGLGCITCAMRHNSSATVRVDTLYSHSRARAQRSTPAVGLRALTRPCFLRALTVPRSVESCWMCVSTAELRSCLDLAMVDVTRFWYIPDESPAFAGRL